MLRSTGSCVSVTAPARLHMGFLDLNGQLGRRFGSIGLTLEQPFTRLRVAPAARLTVSGPDSARADQYARRLIDRLGIPSGVEIVVEQAIPAHAGLGSGTQLALAVGMGIARLFSLNISAAEIAALLDRGARSGIGIGAFEHGGFILDGGRGRNGRPPPRTCRLEFPDSWRILLIFDQRARGLDGEAEKHAFVELPTFKEDEAGQLCRLVVMQALPALAEADAAAFGAAISELQRWVGDYFAPVQGGRFASPVVAAALDGLSRLGKEGLGQSSWGPTGFAICESEVRANELLEELTERWKHEPRLSFAIVKARNYPAEIELETIAPQRGYTVG